MENRDLKTEPQLTKYLYNRAGMAGIPLGGTFELTPLCNFNCRMCYVRKSVEEVCSHGRPCMTLKQWLTIAEEAKSRGMLYLLLTGGEPFLWPDFWILYEQLCGMGFLISINTNGSLIDWETVDRLAKMPPTRINITLYGAGEESYRRLCGAPEGFKKTTHAIDMLKEAGIMVKLNGSLTPDNVRDLEACIDYAKARGLIYETATYMFPPIRRDLDMAGKNERFTPKEAAYYRLKSYRLQFGEERYRKYLENIEKGYVPPVGADESCTDPVDGKIRCRAGKAAFWVSWDGWLTPCGMMTDPKQDLYRENFGKAWENLTEECSALKLSGVCARCPDQKLCHSCAAMAEAETGSPSGIPTYLCGTVTALKELAEEELVRMRVKTRR